MNASEASARKPDLVLIHGWGLGPAAWSTALPALEARFNVISLAFPGYGDDTPEPVSFIETATRFAAAVPDGTYVCGWSLGAMLALQIAAQTQRKLAGLILVGATPSFIKRTDWHPAQEPALLDSFCKAIEHDAGGTLQRFVALINQGDAQARGIGRVLNKLLKPALPATPETLLKGLAWLRDVDLRATIAAVTAPALLIHGARDPLMPLAAAQWLAANLPEAELKVVPDAAHAPFLHDPEVFAKLIGEYCHADARP